MGKIKKKNLNKNQIRKAQVSTEMIVILTVLILGAVILASLLLNLLNKNIKGADDIDVEYNDFVDDYILNVLYNDNDSNYVPLPSENYFNLSLSINIPGGGSVFTSGSYLENAPVTISANPTYGYNFLNWTNLSTGDIVSNNLVYTFIMPSEDLDLVANFIYMGNCELQLYANPSDAGTVNGDGVYVCGTVVTARAIPNLSLEPFNKVNGNETYNFVPVEAPADDDSEEAESNNYTFYNWTDENGTVLSTNQNYTFVLDENKRLYANFIKTGECNLTLHPNPSDGGTVEGAGNYSCGTEVTIVAIPNTSLETSNKPYSKDTLNFAMAPSNYNFFNWTDENGNIISTDTEYTFVLTDDTVLYGNFVLEGECYLGLYAIPYGGGQVYGDGYYPCGSEVVILAEPNVFFSSNNNNSKEILRFVVDMGGGSTSYTFLNWMDVYGEIISTDPEYRFVLLTNTDLYANFEEIE